VALVSATLISLDPFFLSDSRVNRAEGLLTGLMMMALLALIAAHHPLTHFRPAANVSHATDPAATPSARPGSFGLSWRHLLVSALFSGLAWLTKSQALVLVPIFAVISLIWHLRVETNFSLALRRWVVTMIGWVGLAVAIFVLLWPATWTVPGPTFRLMFNYATRKVGEEGVKLFFLGQTILNEDPGLLFYPVIFLLRATPLMILGLVLGIWRLARRNRAGPVSNWRSWLDDRGTWVLLAYVLLYAAGMSLGSHKQDRFLMAAFPALNVLAAIGFVYFAEWQSWTTRWLWVGAGAILVAQLVTALPFHPYYFSYFNPLAGGGPVAARLTRIGWGEGMDQVGTYLQSQDDPTSLVVASRFSGYLLGFKGHKLNLDSDGDWTRADKVVFYIQQSQRMLDPSPGVIRYFQQHVQPEKVITIDRIDYAEVYPNPIEFPADPTVAQSPGKLRLYGYSWPADDQPVTTIRLYSENLSDELNPLGVRLWTTDELQGDWSLCETAPGFEAAARTPGEIVESTCRIEAEHLLPGLYDLQVGLQKPDSSWQSLDLAAGWSAVALTSDGRLQRVRPEVAFAHLADKQIPASATRLEHTYLEHVRLLAFELLPPNPRPGQPITITLYWQAKQALEQDADVTLQAFVGGDHRIALVNGSPLGGHSTRPTSSWRPGEVIKDVWTMDLPEDAPAPALVRLDAGLFLPETLVTLPVRNLAGEDIPAAMAELRLEPITWPTYQGDHPLDLDFGHVIKLIGYELSPESETGRLDVTLYWQAVASPGEAYTAFLHLLDSNGELVVQSDVIPGQGLFPTSAWQTGDVVLSQHQLDLNTDLPAGDYRLVAGLYHAFEGTRLPVFETGGEATPDDTALIGRIALP
jgi:hypothetical protein